MCVWYYQIIHIDGMSEQLALTHPSSADSHLCSWRSPILYIQLGSQTSQRLLRIDRLATRYPPALEANYCPVCLPLLIDQRGVDLKVHYRQKWHLKEATHKTSGLQEVCLLQGGLRVIACFMKAFVKTVWAVIDKGSPDKIKIHLPIKMCLDVSEATDSDSLMAQAGRCHVSGPRQWKVCVLLVVRVDIVRRHCVKTWNNTEVQMGLKGEESNQEPDHEEP